MTKSNAEIALNRLMIEKIVQSMVVRGETRTEELVAEIDSRYQPESQFEMEEYSEAILYGKYSVLN